MNPTQLYRHFDSKGNLLYVGISLNSVNRLGAHKVSANWFREIASITVETFPTREKALFAESVIIAQENPLYNRQRKAVEDVQHEGCRILSMNEAADYLGIPKQHVGDLAASRHLPSIPNRKKCKGRIPKHNYEFIEWQIKEFKLDMILGRL